MRVGARPLIRKTRHPEACWECPAKLGVPGLSGLLSDGLESYHRLEGFQRLENFQRLEDLKRLVEAGAFQEPRAIS